MALTQHSVIRGWMLDALREHGGTATRQQVLAHIERHHSHEFTDEDLRFRDRAGKTAWVDRVGRQRQRMIEDGLLEGRTERGILTLTPTGRR